MKIYHLNIVIIVEFSSVVVLSAFHCSMLATVSDISTVSHSFHFTFIYDSSRFATHTDLVDIRTLEMPRFGLSMEFLALYAATAIQENVYLCVRSW